MDLSKEAREAMRAYSRKYYAEHKDACRERKRRYWEKKALEAKAQTGDPEKPATNDNVAEK